MCNVNQNLATPLPSRLPKLARTTGCASSHPLSVPRCSAHFHGPQPMGPLPIVALIMGHVDIAPSHTRVPQHPACLIPTSNTPPAPAPHPLTHTITCLESC